MNSVRGKLEHTIIAGWINSGASVLDLGCGDGELLKLLIYEKGVKAQGLELSQEAIQCCVARGLSIIQQDIDTGLSEYVDKSFDFVVLNQTFQQVKKPDFVLKEALRVGRRVIVSFPNFVNISARIQIFFRGHVPVTKSLPYEWYDTPNLHFLGVADFIEYCRKRGIIVKDSIFIRKSGKVKFLVNLFADVGFFLLSS